jgi:hypothetical protein
MYTIAISLLIYMRVFYQIISGSSYIIHISYDLQVEISMQLMLKLDNVLHISNFALFVLLPDDLSFIVKPKYVA